MRYFFLLLISFSTIHLSSQSRNDSIYTSVDSFPQYPGGDFEMYQHIRDYIELRAPVFRLERLSQKNYYAIVDVVLDKAGEVAEVKLDGRSQDYYLLEEISAAFRSMPNWKPGYKNGQPVYTRIYIPIRLTYIHGALEIDYRSVQAESELLVPYKMSPSQKVAGLTAAVLITGLLLAYIFFRNN